MITYSVRGQNVEIEHNPALARDRTKITVDGEPIPFTKIVGDVANQILPDTVFAYYSGPSNRLESIFDLPLAAFRDAMIKASPGCAPAYALRASHPQQVRFAILPRRGRCSAIRVSEQGTWNRGRRECAIRA